MSTLVMSSLVLGADPPTLRTIATSADYSAAAQGFATSVADQPVARAVGSVSSN